MVSGSFLFPAEGFGVDTFFCEGEFYEWNGHFTLFWYFLSLNFL